MTALPDGGLPTQWLDTIRARHAAAEGGAWHLDPEPHTDPDTVRTTISGYHRRIGILHFVGPYADANREQALHADTDIGLLIAEIDRLSRALATMTAVAESNKRHVQSMHQDLQQAQQQAAAIATADDQRRTCPTHGYLAPKFDPSICTCPPGA